MKCGIDFLKYDTLFVDMKKSEEERMVKYYEAFGWQVYERKASRRKSGSVNICFVRPHKIRNKDALSLLQVKMELAVNRFAVIKKRTRGIAFALGAFLASLTLFFLASGVSVFLSSNGSFGRVFGSLTAIASVLSTPFSAKLLGKYTGRAEKRCQAVYTETGAHIAGILALARGLFSEVENEE